MRRLIVPLFLALTLGACGNVESGPGWDLWAFDRAGPTYSVLIAETQADLDRIWERFDLRVEKPPVDFGDQVVIGLGHAVSGSCPGIEFGGLVIEEDRVFGEFALEENRNGCTADANPAMFWLRVDREVLPEHFTLSLTEDDICRGCDEDTLVVDLTSDAPDAAQWWSTARLLVAVEGETPEDANAFRAIFENRIDVLAILAHDWQVLPRWINLYEEEWPQRVEGFSAECDGGDDCIEDPERVIERGPVCGIDIDPTEGDQTVLISFEDVGCTIAITDGVELFGG